MRLFSNTPKTSPELVRHSIVNDKTNSNNMQRHKTSSTTNTSMLLNVHSDSVKLSQYGKQNPSKMGDHTPPRQHSPSIVRGVSTLGRKFSKRIEKFSDSDTGRKLRMASPSRKYNFTLGSSSRSNSEPGSNKCNEEEYMSTNNGGNGENGSLPNNNTNQTQIGELASMNSKDFNKQQKNRVSRVDSFRNFFLLTTAATSLKTPRAVKRRSNRNHHHPHNPIYDPSASRNFSDVTTSTKKSMNETDRRSGEFSRSHSSGTKLADMMNSQKLNRSMNSFSTFGSELTLTDCQSEAGISDYYSEVDVPRYYKSNNGSTTDITRSNGITQYFTDDDYDKRSVVSDSHHMSSSNTFQQTRSFHHSNRTSLPAENSNSTQYSRSSQPTNGSISHHRSTNNLKLGILPENRAINFQEPFVVYNATNGLQIKSYGLIDDRVNQEQSSTGDSSSRKVHADVVGNPKSTSDTKSEEDIISETKDNATSNRDKVKPTNACHESGYSSDNATSGPSENSSRNSPRGSPLECQDQSLDKNVRERILALNDERSHVETVQNTSSSSSSISRSLTPSPPTVTSSLSEGNTRLVPKALHPTSTDLVSTVQSSNTSKSSIPTANINTKTSYSTSNSNIPPKKPARTKIPLGGRTMLTNTNPVDTMQNKSRNLVSNEISENSEKTSTNSILHYDQEVSRNPNGSITKTAQEQICQTDKRRHMKPKRETRLESISDSQQPKDESYKNQYSHARTPIIDVVAADDEDETGDLKTENNIYSRMRDERYRYNNENSTSSRDNSSMKDNRRSNSSLQDTLSQTTNSPMPVRKEYKMIRLVRSMRTELGIIIAKKKLKDVPTTGFKVVHIEPDGIVERYVC